MLRVDVLQSPSPLRARFRVVTVVLGTYPDDSDAHREARQALLGPILAQNEQVRQRLRGRRTITQVDPDSGEELGDAVLGEDGDALEPQA